MIIVSPFISLWLVNVNALNSSIKRQYLNKLMKRYNLLVYETYFNVKYIHELKANNRKNSLEIVNKRKHG